MRSIALMVVILTAVPAFGSTMRSVRSQPPVLSPTLVARTDHHHFHFTDEPSLWELTPEQRYWTGWMSVGTGGVLAAIGTTLLVSGAACHESIIDGGVDCTGNNVIGGVVLGSGALFGVLGAILVSSAL